MQLADHSAIVALFRQAPGNELYLFGLRKVIIAIPVLGDGAGIQAGHKAGPAGRTDRSLYESVGKGNTLLTQLVQIGGPDKVIPQRVNGIIALLVGRDPKDIGPLESLRFGRRCRQKDQQYKIDLFHDKAFIPMLNRII